MAKALLWELAWAVETALAKVSAWVGESALMVPVKAQAKVLAKV